MELVFGPQLHSGEEAAAMVKEVALILTKIGTCSSKMHGELLWNSTQYSPSICGKWCIRFIKMYLCSV